MDISYIIMYIYQIKERAMCTSWIFAKYYNYITIITIKLISILLLQYTNI